MGRPERQSRTTTDREIDHRPRIQWRFIHGAFGSSRYSARCDSWHGCFLWGGRNAKAERELFGPNGLQIGNPQIVLKLGIHEPIIIDGIAANPEADQTRRRDEADRDAFMPRGNSQFLFFTAR